LKRSDTPNDLPRFAELNAEYEILRELGRGGTAVVYLARERELNRTVAIKVIRATYIEDDEAAARLVREARVVAGLQHPNIVMLYGTRRLQDNSLALIMQYVPGHTLKNEIRVRGALPFDQAARVLEDLGRALAHAHRHRIVHRDIKPENVYLDDESGTARLSDFGIARTWDSQSDLTLPGTAIGTPAYMSPEQIDGGVLDGRSDIYSLGLIGYEMLTGATPWAGESLYSIIYKQKNEPLPSLAERRPGIPEPLLRAIEGALRKDPAERWAGARQFLAALNGATAAPGAPGVGDTVTEEATSPVLATDPAQATSPDPAASHPAAAIADSETIRYERPTPLVPLAPDRPAAAAAAGPVAFASPPPSGRRRAVLVAIVLMVVLAGAAAALAISQWAVGREAERAGDGGDGTGMIVAQDGADAVGGAPVGLAPEAAADDSIAAIFGDTAFTGPEGQMSSGPGAGMIAFALLGDLQQGLVGDTFAQPVVVRVEDSGGRPVSGVVVRFAVAAGDATLTRDTAVTDAAGTAQTRWIPASAGRHVVEARVDGLSGRRSIFEARALPRPVQVAAADSQAAGDAGSGTTTTRSGTDPRPLAIRGGLATGGVHTCQLTPEGTALCWGGNDSGQLGDGSASRRPAPVRVAAPEPLATMAAGVSHTCGIGVSGSAFCWGANAAGQLGDGSQSARSRPVRVATNARFTAVAAGSSHSCALDADGRLYCWGQNTYGQLGDGSRTDTATPVRAGGNWTFRSVAVGWSHTCALTREGAAFCWGSNIAGQLGDGGTAHRNTPTQVTGGHWYSAIAAGSSHSCGLVRDGRALCWGDNANGQLGNGTRVSSASPLAVAAPEPFTALAVGGVHTCGLTRDGAAWCWGRNTHGQLGDGTTEDRTRPVPVAGDLRFTALYASGAHTCGTAASGERYCWGYNLEGQLGDGTRQNRTNPVPSGR
jgi:alpha-tubulin suppressor-like RCC1 family protein/tRNA A-37 threonylcarbamoyl transferase component Bud32